MRFTTIIAASAMAFAADAVFAQTDDPSWSNLTPHQQGQTGVDNNGQQSMNDKTHTNRAQNHAHGDLAHDRIEKGDSASVKN